MITIHIPTPLRPFVNNLDEVQVEQAENVQTILQNLTKENEGLAKHLFSEDGKIRNFVNIYLNDEDIRYQKGGESPVKDGDVISIVPSIAGGLL